MRVAHAPSRVQFWRPRDQAAIRDPLSFRAGVASLGFGILAFHLIPYWIILPSMPAAQRAAVDRSIFEMQWTDRGLYGLGVGTGLCLAALVLYLISKPRMPKAK